MDTEILKLKNVLEQGGFYRTGHPVKTYLKFLKETNTLEELSDKILQRSKEKGYVNIFVDKLAKCLFDKKSYILS